MRRHTIEDRMSTGHTLVCGAVTGLGLCVAVLVSAARDQSPLGAPTLWPWVLAGLQVFSLWSAGRHHWWAWPLGGSVQIYSFLRNPTETTRLEAMA